MTTNRPAAAFVLPHMPHPLLCPDANPGYQRLRDAYDAVRQEIENIDPELILIYSTKWPNVIGHQVQTRAEPEWTHVDEEWHELGSIPYKFRMDPEFGADFIEHGKKRGLEMRPVDYEGFPIDTGTIVALKLIDPGNRFSASVVSCNMYADRAETIVLGKAARDAIDVSGKRTVCIAITNLSNRIRHDVIPFAEDGIHSAKDDEWNRKYLEFLGGGRLEDASQLSRQFSEQANGDQKMKAIWWLAAVMGQDNAYDGTQYGYEGVYGCGCAVVGLVPAAKPAEDLEFDEDDAEVYTGDRNVLDAAAGAATQEIAMIDGGGVTTVIHAETAPKPVGAYPHARRVGDLLFLSGLGPRHPETNEVPGGPVRDADGSPLAYDTAAQTEAVISNMKRVLAASGLSIDNVVDVTCYLIDMDRDFAAFNEIYKRHFQDVQAARTTVEVDALPTPIAVEFKAIAAFPGE